MPHKYFDDQFEDEEVLFVFRKHPIVMRKGLILGCIGILLPIMYTAALTYIYANNPDKMPSLNFFYLSLVLGFVLGGLLFAPGYIAWYFSVFIVTDQRFIQIIQKGFFHKSVVDVGLTQIQMVNYEISGAEQTLLGFGTIMMQTYLGELLIHDVHHPAKIQKKLIHILRDEGVTAAGFPGNSADNKEMDGDEETIE